MGVMVQGCHSKKPAPVGKGRDPVRDRGGCQGRREGEEVYLDQRSRTKHLQAGSIQSEDASEETRWIGKESIWLKR